MDNLSRKEERPTFQLKMESLRATTSFLDTPAEESNFLVFTFLDSMAKRRNGAPNENIVQNHLNIALLNMF